MCTSLFVRHQLHCLWYEHDGKRNAADEPTLFGEYIYPPLSRRRLCNDAVAPESAVAPAVHGERNPAHGRPGAVVFILPLVRDGS